MDIEQTKNTKEQTESILKQVEFYFGDANIQKDRFMKQKIHEDPEGCNIFVLRTC